MAADLDKAIDRAVHELMDVEPRAELRARVIERLEHPRRGFKWTWVLAPVAAAAVIVLAVLIRYSHEVPQPPRSSSDIVLHVAQPTGQTAVMSARPAPVLHVARRANAQRRDIAAAAASEAAPAVVELEPLRPIEAISTPPVAVQALDTRRIGPAPLPPIAQIEVEPVNSSGERN